MESRWGRQDWRPHRRKQHECGAEGQKWDIHKGGGDEKDGVQERIEDAEPPLEPGVKKSRDLSTPDMPKYWFRALRAYTMNRLESKCI